MNIGKLSEYLQRIEEKDAHIISIKMMAAHIWIDCLLPETDERNEMHKRMVFFRLPMEKFQ